MGVIVSLLALLGLLIFIVGAVIWFVGRPRSATLMVVGGMVYAVAQVIVLVDALI